MTRILLSIGYIASNEVGAARTIDAFGAYFARNPHSAYDVCLGVDTLGRLRPGLARFQPFFRGVFAWDERATVCALAAIADGPRPFHAEFSYGGLVNRILILASVAGCDYVLRVDPGTLPPADLWNMIETQVEALRTHRVVSGVYVDRLAFRDNAYALATRHDDYLRFVESATGVNIHEQLTGGALFMAATPGVPALPFEQSGNMREPTLVWGSDDALFQTMGIPTRVFTQHRVPRHDPFGKAKPPAEYFRGVLGMVYLNQLRQDSGSRSWVPEFVDTLNGFLDATLDESRSYGLSVLPLRIEEVAPPAFLDRIEAGFENYSRLCLTWTALVADLLRVEALPALIRLEP
jgi:hypothetical protein